MALTSQYTDTTEPVADTDAEAATNQHLYGVISGCAVTFDATDMTYDVGAGTILHNGAVVQVSAQANAGTLVADGTNPRWATVYLDSTGTEGLVHSTAAADPSKPETGDNVAIAMVLIANGATVASSQTTFDKRVMTHPPRTVTKYAAATQTISASTTFVDVVAATNPAPATFTFSMLASTVYHARVRLRVTYTGTGGLKLQFTGPGSPTAVRITGLTNTVQDGANPGETALETIAVTTAFSTPFASFAAAANTTDTYNTTDSNGFVDIDLFVINGANAGDVTLQAAQNTANGTSVIQIGSWLEARQVSG